MKILILFLSFFTLISANEIAPAKEIKVSGTAKDMVLRGDQLIIATDKGRVQSYDIKEGKFTKEIKIPDIKDFMGDTIPARIFSVDFTDNRYLLLSDSGKGGYANLWIHENNTTTQLLSAKDEKALVKARFIDKKHILLGYLSDEAALFDIPTKKELYKVQLSESKFSDFALNDDNSKAAYSCESGEINVIYTKDGKLFKKLKGINKDNVYKVDFKKDTVAGAGQDRRGSIYNVTNGKGDFIEGSFLIYATALSPNGEKVAFAMDEQNNISIYNVSTKEKIALLKGQKSTLNCIIFQNETRLFSASDDDTVIMWEIN